MAKHWSTRLIDSHGRRDNCFRTCRPFVRPSQLLKIYQNKTKWEQCSLLARLWVWPSGSLMTLVLFFLYACKYLYAYIHVPFYIHGRHTGNFLHHNSVLSQWKKNRLLPTMSLFVEWYIFLVIFPWWKWDNVRNEFTCHTVLLPPVPPPLFPLLPDLFSSCFCVLSIAGAKK